MKKILSLFIMVSVVLLVAGCGNTLTTTKSSNNGSSLDNGTPNFNGQQIKILHGDLREVDPFNEGYIGKYQKDKQDLITAVEEKYNVDIVFEQYPDNAAWGPDRVRAIINSVVAEEPMGQILAISSNWIPDLADQKAIVPITSYDEEFGSEDFTDSLKSYVTYKNDLWGFDVGKRYNDVGIFYNVKMIEDAGLEDPATLWNNGQWTWEKFRQQVLTLSTSFQSEDLYAISGDPAIWAQYMIGSNGSTILDPDTYKIQLTDTGTIQTLDYMHELFSIKQGWDPLYGGDTSPAFTGGKVAFHQGELWFVTASNRFGTRNFDQIGYVPFPTGPAISSDLSNYHIASTSASVWAISAGYEDKNAAPGQLTDKWIYKIWTEMQYWIPEDELDDDLEMSVLQKFSHIPSQEAYMSVKDLNYYEQVLNFMNFYNSGLNGGLKTAVKDGDSRSQMTTLKDKLQAIINERLNG